MRMLLLLASLAVLSGCNELTGSFDDVIAIRVEGSASRRIQEGTTLQLEATALDLAGEPIEADIRWAVIDTAAGITVDSASGAVTAGVPGGPWRVQARVGSLRASPVAITVTGAPDSVAAVGDTVLTATTDASPPLTVKVFDLTTAPGTAPGLTGVAVRFVVVEPTGSGLVLRAATAADTTATADSTTVTTGASGQAAAILRATGTAPDSALVDAFVTTAVGGAVTGSPVRFTIRFQ